MNQDYDDTDDDYTVACPHCGESIYDDVSQCPYCRQYVSSSDFKSRIPKWVWIVVVLATLFAFSLPYLQTVMRMVGE